jgi:hypothetical protein
MKVILGFLCKSDRHLPDVPLIFSVHLSLWLASVWAAPDALSLNAGFQYVLFSNLLDHVPYFVWTVTTCQTTTVDDDDVVS